MVGFKEEKHKSMFCVRKPGFLLLSPLQCWVVTCSTTNTTSALNSLHWLPIQQRINLNWLILSTVQFTTLALNTCHLYYILTLHHVSFTLPPSISSPNFVRTLILPLVVFAVLWPRGHFLGLEALREHGDMSLALSVESLALALRRSHCPFYIKCLQLTIKTVKIISSIKIITLLVWVWPTLIYRIYFSLFT